MFHFTLASTFVASELKTPTTANMLSPDHPTAVVFLDESGILVHDRFFGIGCLRCAEPAELCRRMRKLRQACGCSEELHWASLNRATGRTESMLKAALESIDLFFDLPGLSFSCLIADRQDGDLVASHGNAWAGYQHLAERVLVGLVDDPEVISVIADHVDTPDRVRFERDVRSAVNRRKGRLAVATLCRIDSRASEGLQLVDLLLGAAMFDFRQGTMHGRLDERSQKGRVAGRLLARSKVTSFRPSGKVALDGKFVVEMARAARTRRGTRGGRRSRS